MNTRTTPSGVIASPPDIKSSLLSSSSDKDCIPSGGRATCDYAAEKARNKIEVGCLQDAHHLTTAEHSMKSVKESGERNVILSTPPLAPLDLTQPLPVNADEKGKAVDPLERPNQLISAVEGDNHEAISIATITPGQPLSEKRCAREGKDDTSTLFPVTDSDIAPPPNTQGQESFPAVPWQYPPSPMLLVNTSQLNSAVPPWKEDYAWFPRISPYRLFNLFIPLILNTVKAVVTERGNQTLSVTLEWVTGVVVFLILTFAEEFDTEHDHLPRIFLWMFKFDCMDVIWISLDRLFAFQRPNYTSTECTTDHSGNVVTLYRLLVTGATLTFGVTKANLAYSGYSGGTNWIDWVYGVIVTSILYFVGLYEKNSAGLLRALFVEDNSRFLTLRNAKGFPLMIASLCTIVILSIQVVPVLRESDHKAPITPAFFYLPLLVLSLTASALVIYQWWSIIKRPLKWVVRSSISLMSVRIPTPMQTGTSLLHMSLSQLSPQIRTVCEISVILFINMAFGAGLYILMFLSQAKIVSKAVLILTEMMVILWIVTLWFLLAGGWIEECTFEWWPFPRLREGMPERGVTTVVVDSIEPNGQRVLVHHVASWKVVFLDVVVILLHFFLSLVFFSLLGTLLVSFFILKDSAYFVVKVPAIIMLVFVYPFTCWGIVKAFLPPLTAQMFLAFSLTNHMHWATLALFDEVFDVDDFFYFGD